MKIFGVGGRWMERDWMALSWVVLLVGLLGCGASAKVIDKGGPTITEAQAEPATGGKLRIAVMRFDNKTQWDVGRGMRAMLTSTLFRTGAFIVLEREELSDVLREQQLGATGVVSDETAARRGEVEGAEILIYGTVTEFEPGQRGAVTIAGGAQQSRVAIDLRIVDAVTSRVLSSTTVEGKATDVNLSTEVLKYVGASPLYYMEAWNNTPVGSAIRLCIDKAVEHIVSKLL
jgi:curli biogenesis system outer membrane secretion channel CsgG